MACDHLCAPFQVQPVQLDATYCALEVAQNCSVRLHMQFGKDPDTPNVCSMVADDSIICGGIENLGSPSLILWIQANKHVTIENRNFQDEC